MTAVQHAEATQAPALRSLLSAPLARPFPALWAPELLQVELEDEQSELQTLLLGACLGAALGAALAPQVLELGAVLLGLLLARYRADIVLEYEATAAAAATTVAAVGSKGAIVEVPRGTTVVGMRESVACTSRRVV